MKSKILTLLSCAILAHTSIVKAQNIDVTPFETTPLISNPAFTGMFKGDLRINGFYRMESYGSYPGGHDNYFRTGYGGSSFDMPIVCGKKGYIAAGMQLYSMTSQYSGEDKGFNEFQGLASLSFHQALRSNIDIGFGVQGGYLQQSAPPPLLSWHPVHGSSTNNQPDRLHNQTFTINSGISFAHSISKSLNYTLGLSVNSLNEPKHVYDDYSDMKTARYYTATAGADWYIGEKLTLRPAFGLQIFDSRNNLITGNEFRYKIKAKKRSENATGTAVFAGIWYRTNNIYAVTAGIEYKRFRALIGGDINRVANVSNAFETAIRYIVPDRNNKKYRRIVPCTRF